MFTIRKPQFKRIFAAHDSPQERAEFASVAWAETISELEAGGLVTKRRLDLAKRYVLLCTEYEFYYAAATFEAPVKSGPNGGDVFSMSWSAILKMNEQLLKLEDALLITPRSNGSKSSPEKPAPSPTAADKYLERNKAH